MAEGLISRLLQVPDRSFFLFGPRGVGKSVWLRQNLPQAHYFDLLDHSLYLELSASPHRLESLVGKAARESWVVLDEIQKIPALLDEVHRLMESRGWCFALCGSSARKLRRGGVNLLAGRAITLEMEPFVSTELGKKFDLKAALQWGCLPFVFNEPKQAPDILAAYLNTYIKEEIREEGLVRRVPPFLRFLGITGQINGQILNAQNIAREAAVPRSSVEVYFSILDDTLLGYFLPAWQPRLKVREVAHPKFYWFDPGVARAAAGLLHDPPDRTWLGNALETLVFHELRVFNQTRGRHRPISYYRTMAGAEIDFIIETGKARRNSPPRVVCVEVKLAEKWDRRWERAMRDLKGQKQIRVDRMFGVYTGSRRYHFDGVEVMPILDFLQALHAGLVF